jgi:ADP-ribose pyrophosphatase YjhB (NUDIX family)
MISCNVEYFTYYMSQKKFVPKPGQVDYTNIRYAPAISCIVRFRDKILLVKRNSKMRLYPGRWAGITGFLDDNQDLEAKVKEELKEETGIGEENISSIQLGRIFHDHDPDYNKTWILHSILVKVKTDEVKLNWEAEEYVWATLEELSKFNTVPGFDRVLVGITRFM